MSTKAGNWFARFQLAMFAVLEFVASKMFSKHGKRIMFITSLYAQLTQLDSLKAEAVSKLNSVMGLATREEAIQFPAAISSVVWRGKDVTSVLTADMMDQNVDAMRIHEVAKKLVDLCPRWMRYPVPEMERDVATLILNGREMAQAA